LEQVALAVKLSLTYSKMQILAMYAEVAYYGNGYYGLDVASCGYFGKRPSDLTWSQAAVLAGVVNAPSIDDPRNHAPAAHAREAHVLARLVAVGYLTADEARAALSAPLAVVPDIGATTLGCRGPAHQAIGP
jgi:penicillin-binding protein 1A